MAWSLLLGSASALPHVNLAGHAQSGYPQGQESVLAVLARPFFSLVERSFTDPLSGERPGKGLIWVWKSLLVRLGALVPG